MERKHIQRLFFLGFLLLVNRELSAVMYQAAASRQLAGVRLESDAFRRQQVGESLFPALWELEQRALLQPGEAMTLWGLGSGISGEFARLSGTDLVKWKRLMITYDTTGYERVSGAYGAVWNDLNYFPVAAEGVVYENTWMFERTYGGLRGHEGCDLMPPENIPGHYRILSITDGVVEKIGWLPQGGYRIGIRSPSGGYFYYAHLDSYSAPFQAGDEVSAGTVLGLMGDTGYGEEGTRGKFDVHLHLGIYISTETEEELSVNPYWALRYLEYRAQAQS